MKKVMSIALAAAFAATVWADRTANREWVQRNFAPTNLVPRVEALEAGGGGEETDPVFGAWKGGTSIHIGQNASADGDGCILIGSGTWSAEPNAIAIGVGADCEVEEAIAIGKGAVANGWGTIQLGPGRHPPVRRLDGHRQRRKRPRRATSLCRAVQASQKVG